MSIEERVLQALESARFPNVTVPLVILARSLDELRTLIQKAVSDHGISHHDPINERLDALEKAAMTDEQVRRVVGTALVDHMVEEHNEEDERLDDLEERVGKLEKRVSGALDRAVWLLQEPEPAAPEPVIYANTGPEPDALKPASLMDQVRDVFADMYRDMGGADFYRPSYRGTNAYAKDAIEAVAAKLEAKGWFGAADYLRAQLEP